MFYYGGSVFTNVKLVSVMWNKDVDRSAGQRDPRLFGRHRQQHLYRSDGRVQHEGRHRGQRSQGRKQVINRGTYLGQVQITPKNQSTSLTDDDVQAELRHQIKIGALPPQDLNTLYMVYFPDGITITLDGLVSCQSFGAYLLREQMT